MTTISPRDRLIGDRRIGPGHPVYITAEIGLNHNGEVSTALALIDVAIAADCEGADLIHSHTWYANFAGLVGSKFLDVPHVVTSHSLEPHRPWKAEQLGGGYRVSSWAEKTAYEAADAVISVSAASPCGAWVTR